MKISDSAILLTSINVVPASFYCQMSPFKDLRIESVCLVLIIFRRVLRTSYPIR